MQSEKFHFHIISMATYGVGLSGGDRIWIELSKVLSRNHKLSIYCWEEGLSIAKREGLNNVNFVLWSANITKKLGFFINYFARILIGILNALIINLNNEDKKIIFSASEFWQDSIPAVILKLRYADSIWIAAWYQTAPNPLKGFDESGQRGDKHYLKAFLYWFVQLPIKPLITKFADYVIVNNENERTQFPVLEKKGRVMVILGGIDLDKINKYQKKHKETKKIYDGVFQGRFHPQKGVLELIDVWKIVTKSSPKAKLAMIGDGPLMDEVKTKIKNEGLENNIELFGYVFDGQKKYKIFNSSKLVLHPAFYDSGGMASAEAMAFGIPVIGFNLQSYLSYYPKGMIKVPIGDINAFARKTVDLLDNAKIRNKIGKEGLSMLQQNWSWDQKVKNIITKIRADDIQVLKRI